MLSADYIVETTTSIAGTSGDGAVTLSAVTNRPRFSSALSSAKRAVRYVIEETVAKKFEQGLGSVSGNVLTRSRPQVTWDGTTWSDKAPSPLQFGAAPASGNVLIRMSPVVEAMAPTIPARNTTLAGDASWRDYRLSNHLDGMLQAVASNPLVADRVYCTCYRNDGAGLLTGLQLEVTSAVAASNIKWAIADVGPDGLPGNKLMDGNVIASATTGFKTDTAVGTWTPANGLWMPPGWYYLCILPSHAISIRTANQRGSQTPLGLSSQSYGQGDMMYFSGSYASGIPADLSSAAAGGTMHPKNSTASTQWIGLKVTP